MWNKKAIREFAKNGGYLPNEVFQSSGDVNGSTARKFLEKVGFNVVCSGDNGHSGWAMTDCGVYLTTKGNILLQRGRG